MERTGQIYLCKLLVKFFFGGNLIVEVKLMRRHILNMGILLMLFSCPNNILASERIVLLSIPSDVWHQTVYLIADKKNWMEYENFTVQIGDKGQYVYNFPDW